MRDALAEAVEKRTYYLVAVESLAEDVVRLEHKTREGERMDVIWDGRALKASRGGMSSFY